jgi:hypothetical protein
LNGTLHLVVSPATQQLTTPDQEPVVITCKVIQIEATLIIRADASTPDMTETAMIRGGFRQDLRPKRRQRANVKIASSSTEFQPNAFFDQTGINGLGPVFGVQFNSIRILLN